MTTTPEQPPNLTTSPDPAARRAAKARRRILASWRELTGGRRVADSDRKTVVACSGGADSTALAIALGTREPESVVLGHVVHDLRDASETHADRDAVRGLADQLGVGFAEARVEIAALPGNAEANARVARYDALRLIATEHDAPFVATGHHAEDQIETVVMALVRGSGPRGLAGIPPHRELEAGVSLVRPMLAITRTQAEEVCDDVGVVWREDATNRDTRRVRAAVRASVVPALLALRPGVAERIGRNADMLRYAAACLRQDAKSLHTLAMTDESGAVAWHRDDLREADPVVLGEAIRLACAQLTGTRGLDRLTGRPTRDLIAAIRRPGGKAREIPFGPLTVALSRASVTISTAGQADAGVQPGDAEDNPGDTEP